MAAKSERIDAAGRFLDARSGRTQLTASRDPAWLLEEAWKQVGRARTPEDRARALSTFRRAISTARNAGEGTPEVLERVVQLEETAQALYEEVQDDHVRKAIRALGSLRMAIETRLAEAAGSERVHVQPVDYDGRPAGTGWDADRAQVMRHLWHPGRVRGLEVHRPAPRRRQSGRQGPQGPQDRVAPAGDPRQGAEQRRAMADEEGEPNGSHL